MPTASDLPFVPQDASAEFDAYATEYAAGMENPMKRLMGQAADDYIQVKLRWLVRTVPALAAVDAGYWILDYGCGIGTLLRLMQQGGITASLAGCDISGGMLAEAMRCWPAGAPQPALRQQEGATVPFPDAMFDLAIISAVLHHVPPVERQAVYTALRRSLRPGGRLVVFEHNPWNPVTRYVVAHTPIDAHAILLPPGEVRAGLRAVGFGDIRTDSLMFFPPRLRRLSEREHALSWLPLGAQYAVIARAG